MSSRRRRADCQVSAARRAPRQMRRARQLPPIKDRGEMTPASCCRRIQPLLAETASYRIRAMSWRVTVVSASMEFASILGH